jgi:3-hydroxybutyryl-CoA dehydrogenase
MTADVNGLTIGVVGAGAMGRGIAQVAACGGMKVRLFDANGEAVNEAAGFIAKMIGRLAEKGKMDPAEADAAKARIEPAARLQDMADCDVVIEAIVEKLEVKHSVFGELEEIVREDAILASNTSSLSITKIAAGLKRPERFAGMHFFNPVPLMRLVEIIAGELTDREVLEKLTAIGKAMGREPVDVADAPGFLVNQVGRALVLESAHMAMDGVAGYPDIDRVMRDAAGFRMGPFELMDLTALDVTYPASEQVWGQNYNLEIFRPARLLRNRMEAGKLGRKSGEGFYRYPDGKQEVPVEPDMPAYDGRSVWLAPMPYAVAGEVEGLIRALGAQVTSGEPGPDDIILVSPLGTDVSLTAAAMELDARQCVGIDGVFGLKTRRTVMRCPATDPAIARSAQGLFASDGAKATLVADSAGFVAQRVVALMVNIGCNIAQQGVASPGDIDKAVKLGLGYPMGPLEWGDAVGPAVILEILENIQAAYGDTRYRPSTWLKRRALLGMPLGTPD